MVCKLDLIILQTRNYGNTNKFLNEIINLGINNEKPEDKRLSSSINQDANN